MRNVLRFHFIFFHYPFFLFYLPEDGHMVGRNVHVMYINYFQYTCVHSGVWRWFGRITVGSTINPSPTGSKRL